MKGSEVNSIFYKNVKRGRRMKRNGEHFHPISDSLLLLVWKFNVAVNERLLIQRNTLVRVWRRRDLFHLRTESTPISCFAGKKVFTRSLISIVVVADQAKECAKSFNMEPQEVLWV